MFNLVNNFETKIAEFYNAPYAVATDCCTHAIELCLKLQQIKEASCPTHTYLSIPMTFEKINLEWSWEEIKWKDYYYIGKTNIIDAAVFWKENSYIAGTMMCLSFQYRKHLSLGRGGMILLDNKQDYNTLIQMSYDGRDRNIPWIQQSIFTLGYHYYMTPETAQLGLEKLPDAIRTNAKEWTYKDYINLSMLPVFNQKLQ